MTIPFGRRRLILTVALAGAAAPGRARAVFPELPLGADDHELARLSRRPALDVDVARWEGMALIYGGARRP